MLFASVAAVLALTAAVDVPSCGEGKDNCPSEYPCCSASGTCGNGYVCLGGCDPRFSHKPGSCVPMPVFPPTDQTFNGTEGVATYADYLGDADKSPYSYSGNITTGDNNALRIQSYQGTGGSTVSTSHFSWYGKVTMKFKTSGGGGVISDLILMSDVKDEIDYEMVGYDSNNVQANYYWQGQEDWTNMKKLAVSSNTEENYHEYTIDWTEDKIDWIIDGQTSRTSNKEDTKNQTTGQYKYPQTPCRVQFGSWPGGDSPAQGTQEWAGGKIDWNSGQAADKGYFYVDVESITVEPHDTPSGVNKTGSKSYIYTSANGSQSDVAITDDDHVLKATDGTGDNLYGPYGHPPSSSSSKGGSSSAGSSSKGSSGSSGSSTPSSSKAGSSSAAASSSPDSSKPGSSSSKPSSSDDSSSSSSSSGSSGSAGNNAAAGGASGSSSDSSSSSSATSTSTSTSSSSSASSSSATPSSESSVSPKNAAACLVAPLLAAIAPAALML